MLATTTRRPDIDLLRAIAVLSVMLFHFDVPGFNGGFLGVDVFFVISGFLITAHINQQLSSNSFSFAGFYARRIRRLAPALAVTMVLTSIASLAILPRDLLVDFARSQLASTLYVSNIYFWSVADYFDSSSYLKPLLHTWSLAVEEQFYLVWPLFLFLLRGKNAYWFILGAGLLSLVAAEAIYQTSATSSFYMFPFRIFEFSIGALVNALPTKPQRPALKHGLLMASLVFLLGSLAFSEELSRMPGLLNLPLCLATAALIWINHPFFNRESLLRSVFLRVGLISYSAYLVHWPLVVFYKILVVDQLRWFDSSLLVLITLALAELSYRLVEQPAGSIKLANKQRYFFASLLLLIMLAASYLWLAPKAYDALSGDLDSVQSALDNTPARKGVMDRLLHKESFPTKPDAPLRILVVGDSHALDVVLGLSWALSDKPVSIALEEHLCEPLTLQSINENMEELYRTHKNPDTSADKCRPLHANFVARVQQYSPDLIVLSDRWRVEVIPYLANTIAQLQENTAAQVLILGPNFEFSGDPRIILRDIGSVWEINDEAWKRRNKGRDYVEKLLRKMASANNIAYISKLDLVCPKGRCDIFLGDQLSYSDPNHWTAKGISLFGKRLADHPVFIQMTSRAER